MSVKKHSWKSYLFLISSLLVTAAMFLLDPIARVTSESVTPVILAFIGLGTICSIIMAVFCFRTLNEKKTIPILGLIFTILNVFLIASFLWFGANIA